MTGVTPPLVVWHALPRQDGQNWSEWEGCLRSAASSIASTVKPFLNGRSVLVVSRHERRRLDTAALIAAAAIREVGRIDMVTRWLDTSRVTLGKVIRSGVVQCHHDAIVYVVGEEAQDLAKVLLLSATKRTRNMLPGRPQPGHAILIPRF